jgi:glutathione synthase/RimK-type ligase-like ATP-grasp enzyme
MRIAYWKVQVDIKKAIEDRGHQAIALDWHDDNWPELFSEAKADFFVWYPHALHSEYYKLLERSLFIEKILNSRCFPGTKTAYLFQDKIKQKYVFDALGFPSPKTEVLKSQQEIDSFIEKNNFPFLIKDPWAYGGHGIFSIKNKKDFEKFLERKRIPRKMKTKNYIYTQEIIDVKEEYRIITIGNKIILSYRKESGEFLKHVWRGAKVFFDVEDSILKKLRDWNKKLKLDFCGWDLIKDKKNRLYLLELNPIFGTKILESKNINLADLLLDYALSDYFKKDQKA